MKTVTLWLDEGLPVVREGSRGRMLLRGSSITQGTTRENYSYIREALGRADLVIRKGG
jgi:predicted chitinase